jgi:hypothetical protein
MLDSMLSAAATSQLGEEDSPPQPTLREQPWTFDKKIQIPLVIALLLQVFFAGWWFSKTEDRLDHLEKALGSVEVKLEGMQGADQRIESKIDRLLLTLTKQLN